MAGYDWQFWVRQFAVDDVEIGAANAAGLDTNADFTGAWSGIGQFLEDQRATWFVECHSKHFWLLGYGIA
jgi:hypothetical protein